MANTDTRSLIQPLALESLPFLSGFKKSFSSVAEMLTVRSKEISDSLHVLLFGDEEEILPSKLEKEFQHVRTCPRAIRSVDAYIGIV